jgi:hypothetical protein
VPQQLVEGVFAPEAGEDHAFDAALDQLVHDLGFERRRVVGVGDEQLATGREQPVLHRLCEGGVDGVGDGGHDQPDEAGTARGKACRQRIGHVAMVRDQGQDALARLDRH